MKKTILAFAILSLVIPTAALAHGGAMMDFDSIDDNFGIMRYIEDQAVGGEAHEEMEDLMVKMLSGAMTQEEAQRMVELMDEYPGAGGMMSSRMMGMGMMGGGMLARQSLGDGGMGTNFGMMPGFGFMGTSGILFWLISLVWLVVGILAIVWFIKKISKQS